MPENSGHRTQPVASRGSQATLAPAAGGAIRADPGVPAPVVTPRSAGQPLLDLLDRVLDRGVVISGGVVISLAGVDLLRLDLRLLLAGVQTALGDAADAVHVGPARQAQAVTTSGEEAS